MALKDEVKVRLAHFGYTAVLADEGLLDFIIAKVESRLIKDCGVWDEVAAAMVVPTGLHQVEVDMMVGEFMQIKKSIGQLTGIDVQSIKSIQEGDTNVTFGQSAEERLDALIASLINPEADLAKYRCIRW